MCAHVRVRMLHSACTNVCSRSAYFATSGSTSWKYNIVAHGVQWCVFCACPQGANLNQTAERLYDNRFYTADGEVHLECADGVHNLTWWQSFVSHSHVAVWPHRPAPSTQTTHPSAFVHTLTHLPTDPHTPANAHAFVAHSRPRRIVQRTPRIPTRMNSMRGLIRLFLCSNQPAAPSRVH